MMNIFILNWKMNPQSLDDARQLCRDTITLATQYPKLLTIIAPSSLHFIDSAHLLEQSDAVSIRLSAQSVGFGESTALTGECSTTMLKDAGAQYAFIGHSERRFIVGESSDIIPQRLQSCLQAGIIPILFIGERELSESWQDEIIDQVTQSLQGLSPAQLASIVYVYEPVWAISSKSKIVGFDGEYVSQVASFLKNILVKMIPQALQQQLVLLYGGSVNPQSISQINALNLFQGVVIGSASLSMDSLKLVYEALK